MFCSPHILRIHGNLGVVVIPRSYVLKILDAILGGKLSKTSPRRPRRADTGVEARLQNRCMKATNSECSRWWALQKVNDFNN